MNELFDNVGIEEPIQKEALFPYLDMGAAFVVGLSIGYALKKSFKVFLFFLGLGLIFVFFLESQGAVNVSEENLENVVNTGIDGFKYIVELLQTRLENYESIGAMSAIAGFFVGLKLG